MARAISLFFHPRSLPAGEKRIAAMGWKVFAVVNGLIVLKTIFDPATGGDYGAFGVASIAMSIPAAVGLALYAFGREWFVAAPWRQFSWLFGAYSVCILGLFLWKLMHRPIGTLDGAIGMIGAIAVVVALQYFNWLALWRYSDR